MFDFRSGFTWRSILAVLYSAVVFTPAVIWISLVTVGVQLGVAIEFCTLFLFIEIARLTGSSISKQEAAVIFGMTSLAGSTIFLNLIYRVYYRQSPLLHIMGIDPKLIPTWWAPVIETGIWEARSFFHPAWILPMTVFLITWLFYPFLAIFLGLIGRELFIETERLPFPIQQINVEVITTLIERREDRLNLFTCSAILSFIYAILLYAIPIASRAAGYPIQMFAIPWYDFWYYIQDYFPGASFGISTDAMIFAMGIMLPSITVLSMFIGSFVRFFILNWLFVKYNFSEWAARWAPGMDIVKIFQESTLYFWACPIIGMTFAIGLSPMILQTGTLKSALKTIFSFKRNKYIRIGGKRFSLPLMITFFTLGQIPTVLFKILVPDFPLWGLILYNVILPFIGLLAFGRMIGETGQEPSLPYLQNLVILITGYNKIDAWFLPLQFRPGSAWLAHFKICQLTQTSVESWIKMYLFTYPITILLGFIYTQLFWLLAPIPSAVFPAPAITWPVEIIYHTIWITRPVRFFKPDLILLSFLNTSALVILLRFLKIPFSMVGAVVGMSTPIPSVFTMFIGFIFGKFMEYRLGKKWFMEYRSTIAAGIVTGEGLAIIIGVTLALIIKSIWARPF